MSGPDFHHKEKIKIEDAQFNMSGNRLRNMQIKTTDDPGITHDPVPEPLSWPRSSDRDELNMLNCRYLI